MWISVRIGTALLDKTVALEEVSCVSRRRVSIQTPSSGLATRWFSFSGKTRDQDMGILFQAAREGQPRMQKKGQRDSDHGLSTQRWHWLAAEPCHISEQCLAIPCALKQTIDILFSSSCRGRGPLLLSATITPWGQKKFRLRTERQLPVCPSPAQLPEVGVGREQQWGSQGCAWGGDNKQQPLGPAPAESCTDRQELPEAETVHSHRPAQEQVRGDQKNWLVGDSKCSFFSFQ